MVKARLLHGFGEFKVSDFGGEYPLGYATYCDGSCPDVLDERLFKTYEEAAKYDLGLSMYCCNYDIHVINGEKYISACEYAVEYIEVDEDGEFLNCIGFDTADIVGDGLKESWLNYDYR